MKPMFIAHLPAGYILTKKIQLQAKVKKYHWAGYLVLKDWRC